MSELRAAYAATGEAERDTLVGGAQLGYDVVGELERVRANLVALAQVVEQLRSAYNGHTHNGAVPAPPAGEQSALGYTLS